ncbi:glycosyltransferase family 2 protein [Acetobacter oeni]|uniref:Glycosyl transferase family 2 n=1 Tax=Acetobacter oeni TaxID=304077 RepID=A0A511XHQ0_9PROT|nr:glycosyltransferase family 2 protein [Acetobacter oeni]MBB3882593.1 hypothetical protein [Acetobacter oeni]NHO18598.1 hypothetical protein [Acetobacter oeni]GBR12071.1 hypothetical protein AA21952_3536 [Acetobacter oeni LMG 21952]GEN62472.1 hypothetical protein AOE01nite_06960 [Acetobacter oeni]
MAGISEAFIKKSIDDYSRLRSGNFWTINDTVMIDGLRRACFFMIVRDSADTITLNLEHHFRLGFRRFFILDNNSTDGTGDLILAFRKNYPEAGVFYMTDFQIPFFQAGKMAALTAFAEAYLSHDPTPPDWLFFVDADEFITCCTKDGERAAQAFNMILADPGNKVLVLNWAHAALYSEESRSVTTFGATLGVTPCVVSPTIGIHVTKIACRAGCGLLPNDGNHFVSSVPLPEDCLQSMTAIGFMMLHFPMRSVVQIKQKIDQGVAALNATDLHETIGAHWRHYHRLYTTHGEHVLNEILMEHVGKCL